MLLYACERVLAGTKAVVRDATLRVGSGECVVVTGSNGSGKSTLLKSLFGLGPHDVNRRLHFDGRDLSALPSFLLPSYGILYFPQTGWLFETLSVEENISLCALSTQTRSFEVRHACRVVESRSGIPVVRKVAGLSGGERRQVEASIALLLQPRALLMDEPLAGLSPGSALRCCEIFRVLQERGSALVLAEHRTEIFHLNRATHLRILDERLSPT